MACSLETLWFTNRGYHFLSVTLVVPAPPAAICAFLRTFVFCMLPQPPLVRVLLQPFLRHPGCRCTPES
ncbi:unnamed protein product [Ixodes persulcatus]